MYGQIPFYSCLGFITKMKLLIIECWAPPWNGQKSLMPPDFLFNSYDRRVDGKIKGVISIPRLQAEARSEIHTHWSPTKLLFQMDSSATAYSSTISKRVAWRYGMCPSRHVSPFQGTVCLRVAA